MKMLISMIVLVSTSAFANTTQKLMSVTNDRGPEVTETFFELGGTNEVLNLIYAPQGGSARKYTPAQIAKQIVLEEQQGVQAVLLKGTLDNVAGTGKWTYTYVANGFTKKYESCDVTLKRSAQGTWAIYNSSGNAVPIAKVITWSMGIKTLQGICD